MSDSMTRNQREWLRALNEGLPRFLRTLQSPTQIGRFYPCVKGATEVGRRIALGFSCFGLKLYYMLGLWPELKREHRCDWIAFLNSFQVDGSMWGDPVTENAFVDGPEIEDVLSHYPRGQRLVHRLLFRRHLTPPQMVVIAETKQTIATMAEVGESPARAYRGFPRTASGVTQHLARLNWRQPWGAGGQAAALTVFAATQAPLFLGQAESRALVQSCAKFFEGLADRETGSYCRGRPAESYELINGAMKVLTALDWLDVPVHYPERLIDSCLKYEPLPDGCNLVDAVYVLYRCSQQTAHRRQEVLSYSLRVLDMIKPHHNQDGGLSFQIGRSQSGYYGVEISRGLPESDIHGTILLSWAIAMILEILDDDPLGWRVIKP